MSGPSGDAGGATERVRALVRTRQVREFTDTPPTDEELHALTEVARWSAILKGSTTGAK